MQLDEFLGFGGCGNKFPSSDSILGSLDKQGAATHGLDRSYGTVRRDDR